MLQRLAKIRRFNDRNKGQDGVEVVQCHLNRMNGRGARRIKGRRQPIDLGEGGVRVQRKEGLKPFIPIRKAAQNRKRGGRAQPVHPVFWTDHVTAATMGHRKLLAQDHVTIGCGYGIGDGDLKTGAKGRALIRRKAFDRAFPDVGCQPIPESGLPGVVLNAQMVDNTVAGKDRITGWAHRQRHNTAFVCNNAYPGLERKAWKNMLQQAGVCHLGWGGQADRLLRPGRGGGERQAEAQQDKAHGQT